MGSPLGPSLANTFLSYHEKKTNWFNNCPKGFKPVFYRRYVDDIFMLFKSNDHLNYFKDFLNSCHNNMHFLWKQKKRTNYPFLTLKLYANKANLQPQFTENLLLVAYVVTLKAFLPSVYKFGMVYTLVYRCYRISSN